MRKGDVMKKRSAFYPGVFALAMGMLLVSSLAQEKGAQGPPPARKIPGITAPDAFPNACVDCHLNYAEMQMDTRFSTLLQRLCEKVEPGLLAKAQAAAPKALMLEGQHPEVGDIFDNVPASCLSCHGEGSETSPPFSKMIHAIHLTGGEANHFLTLFQGECTHCHKLDQATGLWTIPSGAEKK